MWKPLGHFLIGILITGSVLANPTPEKGGDSSIWIHNGHTFCQRLSTTFVMRNSNSCGPSTFHCITPIRCFGFNSSSTGVVVCPGQKQNWNDPFAAASKSISPPFLSCPNLQQCADDPNPELETVDKLGQWASSMMSSIKSHFQKFTAGSEADDHSASGQR